MSVKERIHELFTEHPHSQGMTYVQHAWRALSLSSKMGKGCVALLLHAIFPFLFQSTGTNMIRELYDDLTPSSPPPSPLSSPSSPSSIPIVGLVKRVPPLETC